MNSQLTAYITLICTSGVLNLYLCLYVFAKRHHYNDIARFFILYTGAITVYCFGAAFGLISTTLEQMTFWTVIQYAGMPFSAPLGLLFIMYFLGKNITKRLFAALLVIPFISFIMVATNHWHHLHYRVFEVDPVLGFPYIYQEIGIWYVIHGVFTFASMFVAFLLALSHWKETARVYRPQIFSLVIGQLVPMLTAFLYLIGFAPQGIDPVPMVLWVSSLLYLWAIHSSRMFSIMPIAKDTIFNSINDGVMVLDESCRLIEFNHGSRSMFPLLNKSMFGMDFNKVWFELSGDSFPFPLETSVVTKELKLTIDGSERIYQVRTSALHHANNRNGLLVIFTEITELKMLQLKLEHQAYYDELTQIFNRRAFFQMAEQDFAAAQKVSSPFTIILMDIDHFKSVNDTYGHSVGDQVLMHVAKACEKQLVEGMIFARYGGEEFVLSLMGCTAYEGEKLADQLRKHIAAQPLLTPEGVLTVTLSFGVAEAAEDPEETLNQLLIKADKALYSAKREGRNQVQVYAGT